MNVRVQNKNAYGQELQKQGAWTMGWTKRRLKKSPFGFEDETKHTS